MGLPRRNLCEVVDLICEFSLDYPQGFEERLGVVFGLFQARFFLAEFNEGLA